MNKQEKNIVDILTFDEIEDIVDIFIDKVYHTDKTVALITDKELVEYAMDELLNDDCITIKRVDLELDSEDAEYMISVDDDGYMVVQPVEYYDDKYFNDIEYAFVDMDGCVEQMTIDNLLNRDVEIELFGYEDECGCDDCDDCEEGFTVNGRPVSKEEFDNYVSQFRHDEKPATTSTAKSTYKINGKECSKEEFDKKYEEFEEMYLDNIRDMLLSYSEFMDEVNEWRSRMLLW
ncbi:hypothetical protein [Bariatricus sp. SGI.019]|uniref:hypothetical protein n=1 Tax=Bariatricus sp. SGI.019 TaxID=3420548 RepID=UPI003CFC2EE6